MSATRLVHNAEVLATTPLRTDALKMVEAAYSAINTGAAVKRKVVLKGEELVIGDRRIAVGGRRIFFVGVGKCAAAASEAFEEILGERITGGIALDVAMPPTCNTQRIECILGTHPEPSEVNEAGTKRIIELLSGLKAEDLAIILVSGGGSTLLCHPTGRLTCTDERTMLQELFRTGATIQEINTLRKHISPARGGGLAKAAYPAEVVGLVISDVPGNELQFIASGPTVRDSSSADDARAIVEKYSLHGIAPDDIIETPKEAKFFERVHNTLLISNRDALEAMRDTANALGYSASIVSETIAGEAHLVAHDILAQLRAAPPKTALLYGGETTVTMEKGGGKGGRCQEMALSLVEEMKEGELVVPLSSDGRDNSDAAGAIADTRSAAHAHEKGLSVAEYLAAHRSYDFFAATGDRLLTGYTGSNVSDLLIALQS